MINEHYRALMDIHMPTNCSVSSLRTLCDEMEKHFRSLEALAQDITSPSLYPTSCQNYQGKLFFIWK